jgi:hypothetical protein
LASIFIGRDASAEFFKGPGTSLSAGLACIVAQALFTLLSLHGGGAGTVGNVGLIVVGAGATVGALSERITYLILSLRSLDPTKAAIASVGIFLSSLTTVLGPRRLFVLRRRGTTQEGTTRAILTPL